MVHGTEQYYNGFSVQSSTVGEGQYHSWTLLPFRNRPCSYIIRPCMGVPRSQYIQYILNSLRNFLNWHVFRDYAA